MKTTEVVQLKSGITTVIELTFGLPKSHFVSLCDSWQHLQLWQLKKQIQVKWDNAKHSLSLTRKSLFLYCSFSDISYTFSHFFNQKLFIICIHLSLFMHTVQNNTILSSSSIINWKSGIFLVKVPSAWWNTERLIDH